MTHKKELRIWQNNIHKNRERNYGILSDLNMTKYTILMIQEQYWTEYTGSAPTHHAWTLHEPNATEEQAPRVAIYTNNKHLSPARVAKIPLHTLDATAIEIQPSDQDEEPTLIVNIYNPSDYNGTVAEVHEQ